MAASAQVSPATVSRIEHGQVSPSLDTLDRVVAATGNRLVVTIESADRPLPTPKDERSDRLHRLVASELLARPSEVIAVARANLNTMRTADPTGRSGAYLDRWAQLLDGELHTLVAALVDPSQSARDLRQASPFAGVLSEVQRTAALARRRA